MPSRGSRRSARRPSVEIVEEHDADLAVVLGGDGTMLRALHRFLGSGVPVIGVNFGRVGFLSAMGPDAMEEGSSGRSPASGRSSSCRRWRSTSTASRRSRSTSVCATSAIGRMVELAWSVGGEDLGVQPCDGVICATSTGSTAYNLSSGGPVLVWGLDAMAVTFVSPHRCTRGRSSSPRARARHPQRDAHQAVKVIADGMPIGELDTGREARVRLGERRGLLALLPEMTFFHRYRETFAS